MCQEQQLDRKETAACMHVYTCKAINSNHWCGVQVPSTNGPPPSPAHKTSRGVQEGCSSSSAFSAALPRSSEAGAASANQTIEQQGNTKVHVLLNDRELYLVSQYTTKTHVMLKAWTKSAKS